MSCTASNRPAAAPSVVAALLPIMAVVLVAFLVVGLALPVLPLHVHQGLGLGTFAVGLVAASQFAASFISRLWSGHYADSRGAKRAVATGLLMAAASGLLYLLSLRFVDAPATSVAVLLAGQALLGGAESFVVTGAPAWGLALGSIGFGAMTAFVALLSRSAAGTRPGLTLFALAFIAVRSVFGHLPDTIGGARVALVSVAVEAAGLALIGLAPRPALALAGAVLTGLGYSLVYPGFGAEAVRRAPPESRGLAMGAYTACLDLALGIAGPALGLVAGWAGLGAVFLASALVVLCAAAVAARFLRAAAA